MQRTRLISDIKTAEGCRLKAYKDTRGFWTVGYGHYLNQKKDWTGVEFDIDLIEQWLEEDVDAAILAAQTLDEWSALDTDARQNAVAELVFNMGLHKWMGFKHARAAMACRDWPQAKAQLIASAWHGEVGRARSDRIERYILSGEFDGT